MAMQFRPKPEVVQRPALPEIRPPYVHEQGCDLPPRRAGRPPSGKVRVTMLLEPEVIAKFKAGGEKGWQKRMNDALKALKL